MHRRLLHCFVVATGVLIAAGPVVANSDTRSLPMQFELQHGGPAEACLDKCRVWVSATGAITPDTPDLFETFAKGRDLRGVPLVLDSDGGSVLGAISLGRQIRRLGMTTAVGRTVESSSSDPSKKSVRVLPDAYCESMCPFVLLAGVKRNVPSEARVLVHQIWLGGNRDDPTAATYSAEDLVVVQRDVGQLAKYTIEMSGTIDLLALALKIPPWEPMRLLSSGDLRDTGLVTANNEVETRGSASNSTSGLASGPRIAIGNQKWNLVDHAGQSTLTRRHPLTFEGENIGTFDLAFSCGVSAHQYGVTYIEQYSGSKGSQVPTSRRYVELYFDQKAISLEVMSSSDGKSLGRDSTVARGEVPTALVKTFAEPRNISLTVETSSLENVTTAIRIGNTGLARSLAQFASSCANRGQQRAAARAKGHSSANKTAYGARSRYSRSQYSKAD